MERMVNNRLVTRNIHCSMLIHSFADSNWISNQNKHCLLILLCYHAQLDAHDLYFKLEPKKGSKVPKIWNMKSVKTQLGHDVCNSILFIHATLGCDTTMETGFHWTHLDTNGFVKKRPSKHPIVQPQSLRFTSAAARYNNLHVYHQIQKWKGHVTSATEWGWGGKVWFYNDWIASSTRVALTYSEM